MEKRGIISCHKLFVKAALVLMIAFCYQQAFSQSQCDRIGDNGSDQSTNGNCAPVTLDFSFNYEFIYGVDPDKVEIYIDWDDGTDTLIKPSTALGDTLFGDTLRHQYPLTGEECSYTAEAYVVYDGDHCTSSTQSQTFRSWNIDNENGGEIVINPERALVCEGDPVYQIFRDASEFNCNINVEHDRPNLETRWVQFIYGTQHAGGDRIPNVTIEDEHGTVHQMTDAAGNSLGTVNGPIVEIPYEAYGPNQVSYPVIAPPDGVAGDVFEITMRNWNICNPYDDNPYDGLPPSDPVNGDNPPIITHAWVEIISTPPNVPNPYNEFCAYEPITLNASGPTDTIRWYSDSAMTNLVHVGPNFDPTNAPFNLDNTVGGEYSFWVTAVELACESAPLKVDLKIYDMPSPARAGDDQALCTDHTQLQADAATVGTAEWTTSSTATLSDINDPKATLSNIPEGSNSFTWTITNGPCVLSDEVDIVRDLPPLPADAGNDITLCNDQSVHLNANQPTNGGNGEWSLHAGNGSFSNENDHNTLVSDIYQGYSKYIWEISSTHDACPRTSDTLEVLRDVQPDAADAGPDRAVCDSAAVQLNGNALNHGGTGIWSVTSGSGVIDDINNPETRVNNLMPGLNSFRWSAESRYGVCPATQDEVNIRVDAHPGIADAGPDQSFCDDTSTTLNANNPVTGNGVWSITRNPSGNPPYFTPDVHTSNAGFAVDAGNKGKYILEWNLVNGSCVSTDEVVIDFGVDNPIVEAGPSDTVCGTTIQLNATPFAPATGTWKKISGPGDVIFFPDSITPDAHAFITTGNEGAYTFEWKMVSGSCAPVFDTVTVVYNKIPEQPVTFADSSCGPQTMQLSSEVGQFGTYNYWYDDEFTGNRIDTALDISTSILSSTASYWVSTFNDSTGCESDRTEVLAKVFTIPERPVVTDLENCGEETLTLNGAVGANGNTNYWYLSKFQPNAVYQGNDLTYHFKQTTTIWVATVDTMTGCESERDSALVTIHPIPEIPVANHAENCGPTSFTLNSVIAQYGTQNYWYDAQTDNTPMYADTSYPTAIIDSSRSYWVASINDTTLCTSDKKEVKVTIHGVPENPQVGDLFVCGPSSFDLSASINEFGNTLRFYSVPVNGNPIAQEDTFYTPVISDDRSYWVSTYNDTTYCESGREQLNITINDIPPPVSITGAEDLVVGQNGIIYYVIGLDGSTYDWDIPADITLMEDNGYWVKLGFPNVGDFNISVQETSVNGCPGSITNKQVSVTEGLLSVDINLQNPNACSGTDFHIKPDLLGGKSPFVFEWTGDTTFLSTTNELETYLNAPDAGIFQLVLNVTDMNQKTASDTVEIQVFESPEARIIAPDTMVCVDASMQLDVETTDDAITHSWNGQVIALSSTTISNPVFQPTSNETFKMSYTVTDVNFCKASDTVVLHTDQPHAKFTSDAQPGCSPVFVTFTNQSKNYDTLHWDFDDGNVGSGQTEEHWFENASSSVRSFDVKLTATSKHGCSSSAHDFITVYPNPAVEITGTPDSACHPAQVLLTASPGHAVYEWDFGNGQIYEGGYNTVQEFRNETTRDTTFNIKLISTSSFNCHDTAFAKVTVFPSPVADFFVSPKEQMFPDATVSIDNLTSGNWDYHWYFGDGTGSSASEPGRHTYPFPNNFNISLVANDGRCRDSTVRRVLVKPHPPEAKFAPIEPGCMPLTVSFVNSSTYADSYYWEFGDGSVSNKPEPSYTYYEPGIYKIKLTVKGDGGEDTHSDTSRVYILPNSFFDLAPRYVYVNDEPVHYFNLSDHGDIFEWDFGDGTTSNEWNPKHVYKEEGTYDVTLKVWTENDCFDLYVMENAVLVEPYGNVEFPNAFRPSSPIEENRTFLPGVIDNVEDYHLMIYNRWGEFIFESFDQNIGWDGYYQGRIAKQDVYVWKVTGVYSNGESFVKTGDVTLLH
jgi:PKD repeat protein